MKSTLERIKELNDEIVSCKVHLEEIEQNLKKKLEEFEEVKKQLEAEKQSKNIIESENQKLKERIKELEKINTQLTSQIEIPPK